MPSDVAPGAGTATFWLIRSAALATLGMVLLSWPLWAEGGAIPRVPFVPGFPRTSPAFAWALFAALVGSLASTAVWPRRVSGFAASLVIATALVLQDQHRFQPWLYQYAALGTLLYGLPEPEGSRYARWWFVSLYFHSGLSKLDRSFCDELGGLFLAAAARAIGVESSGWAEGVRVLAILAMPIAEILIALALLVPPARGIGLVGAVLLHAALIAILGPAGLGHSPIVLVWNATMIVEISIIFGMRNANEVTFSRHHPKPGYSCLVKAAFWVGVLMPFAERWEAFDAWPSHALYSSHVGRVGIFMHQEGVDDVPASTRKHLHPVGVGPWLRLDLTGWGRDERGTPVYPQNRACLGLAEGLAARYGGRGRVRVVVAGPAELWTGARVSREAVGLEAIRREADHFWLNAHPAPAVLP